MLPQELDFCPDPFSRSHSYINLETGKIEPARCKKWSCYFCCQKNYYLVAHKASRGKAQRFITLSRAGTTSLEIKDNLRSLLQACRREKFRFEYFAVPELHQNGQAHLHLLQRGDFLPFDFLQDKWSLYTSKNYDGSGSLFINIKAIRDAKHARNYLLKYMRKSWRDAGDKGWAALQNNYPGMHHYRCSRKWDIEPPQEHESWVLVQNCNITSVLEERLFGEPLQEAWNGRSYSYIPPVNGQKEDFGF